ncbi:MAG: tyrosine--tRNA ligase [Candidatus Coatesbacteria bacterium]|nr:tyrosine--tRNA ligase [Candidatus Coatesbacteria bacterium]
MKSSRINRKEQNMHSPEQQLFLLMYGTKFADEDEDFLKNSEDIPKGGLREQMSKDLLARLKEGKPLRVYLGVDPTKISLHIGHLLPVLKLKTFQELGHQVVFLIGDYTGLIGDPSGQSRERQQFTHEDLMENAKGYTDQAFKVLDPEKTEIRFNGEWLSRLQFKDLVKIASYFPLKQIIARRDFQERMEKGVSLRFHETLYALMQGYDAYALECDVQVGAYDQHFNMLAGRIIQENMGQKPHIMLTVPLLMGTDGRKMSKSFGNTINVLDSPSDMYAKVMRISDSFISHYLDLATDFSIEEKENLKKRIEQDPMGVKKRIAFNVTQRYHKIEGAEEGERRFRESSQERQIPLDIENAEPLEINEDYDKDQNLYIPGIFLKAELVESASIARTLIKQNGLKIYDMQMTNLTYDNRHILLKELRENVTDKRKEYKEIIIQDIRMNLREGFYILQKGKHNFRMIYLKCRK